MNAGRVQALSMVAAVSLWGWTACRGEGAATSMTAEVSAEEGAGEGEGVERREEALVVHEWGTFTSMQDSRGRVLEGLHHEEEGLPPFVYGRDIGASGSKAMESLPEGVTQKLETPVIYFHAGSPQTVRVEVDFPSGVISQWYPAAERFAPEVGRLERMGGGAMAWDVELMVGSSAELPWVPEEDVWAPSRLVDAAPVAVGEEQERFIFYRGLGRFEVPFEVTSVGTTMTVTNRGEEEIPAVFLLHVHEEGGSVTDLGSLGPGASTTAAPSPKEDTVPDYLNVASDMVAASLVEAGLYEDEAIAMVDTWRRSYFLTPGLRVLYVVPEAWTAELLPMRLEPQPDELVRTLVGRVEVLTDRDERELAATLEAAAAEERAVAVEQLGRFAEPRLRRALELLDGEAARALCERLIEEARQMP